MTSIAGHERIIVAKSNYLSTIALSAAMAAMVTLTAMATATAATTVVVAVKKTIVMTGM